MQLQVLALEVNKKMFPAQKFSWDICEILKNT